MTSQEQGKEDRMSTRISLSIFSLTAILTVSLCGLSQPTGESKTLHGSVHPLAAISTDNGLVPDIKPLSLKIYIAPNPVERVDLEKLLVDQRTSGTPSYHQWLTPEQFGESFGISTSDEAKVRSWLKSQGFTGVSLSRSRTVFDFSSTVGQASSAFHTSVHSLMYKGQKHFANTSNISLPGAISNLVLAVAGLNDFRPTPQHISLSRPARPQYTTTDDQVFSFAPGDIALEYDLQPLYASGIDGTGITAVVIGQSDIDVNDIRAYRAAFNLPANDPKVLLVPGSTDIGIVPETEVEADIDLEVLGGVARGANLLYVQDSDVDAALQYAIDQNLGSVINFSYAGSEYIGQTWGEEQATYQLLAQQANAQGITILAASGDTGAAGSDLRAPAVGGMVVSSPADIPEVTGVGGTSLPYDSHGWINQWFSTTNDAYGASLLAFTPEVTWNDSMVPTSISVGSLSASSGGASLLYPKPAWQQGPGVPADGARDVPDVSMYSMNNGAGYIICYAGDCPAGQMPDGLSSGTIWGGTSASTPVFAGVVVLLNQYLLKNGPITSPGLGNINPTLYQLAANATGVFHDITQGNNMVPCEIGTPDCTTGTEGYNAGPGYDLATGLGSVDAYNLAYEWASYSPAATTLILVANPQPVTVGENITLKATVVAGSGIPTGTVSFYSVTNPFSQATLLATVTVDSDGTASFAAGSVQSNVGAYYAAYSGATGYSASLGGPIAVAKQPTVTPTTTTLVASSDQIALGSSLTLTANVTATSGEPTGGTVAFMDGTTSLGTAALSGGESSISISTLSAGSHSITATYQPLAGSDYSVSTSAPITVKVNAPDFTLSATSTSLTVTAGSTATTTLNIAPLNGFSGSMPTMSCSGLPSGANCAFGTPVKQADGSTNIPLSITTAATKAEVQGTQSRSGFYLAFLPLLFCIGRRRKALVRALYSFALFACLAVIGLGASGCGGGSGVANGGGNQGGSGGDTPVTNTVTVTASSAGITHQVQITLTVN
jgi:hypothetical protein